MKTVMKMLFLLLCLAPRLQAQTTYTVPFNVAPPGCEMPWSEASVPMKIQDGACEWSSGNGTLSVIEGELLIDLSDMPGVLQTAQLNFQNSTCNSCLLVRFLNDGVLVQEILVTSPGQPVNFTNPGSPVTEIVITNYRFTINSLVLTMAPPLSSSISGTPTCANQSGGTAGVEPIGGVEPYQIEWSTGATTAEVSGLAPGTYSVSLTDQLGQYAENIVTIEAINLPNVWFESFTDVSCYGGSNGSADINLTGALAPISVFWPHDSATVNPRTDLSAGIFEAQVTDGNGCVTTIDLSIEQPAPMTVTEASHINIDCVAGNSSQVGLIAIGGVGGYSYHWSNGQSGNPLQNVPAGIYIASVTDANGCLLTYSSEISSSGALPVVITAIPPACNGAFGTLVAAVGNDLSDITYFWQDSIAAATVNGPAGTYWVAAVSPLGCSGYATFEMTEPDSLNFQVLSVEAEIGGQQNGAIAVAAAGGTAPYSFEWSGPNGFSATGDSLNGLTPGEYNCTMTDFHGCEIVLSEPIVVDALTGIFEGKQESIPVEINPNPASDVLHIRTLAFDGMLRLTLLDQSGRTLSTTEIPAGSGQTRYELNVSGITPGLYVLQLFDGQRFATRKVMIAR